ncbi:hypothetical protein QOT17_008348 [Balamuthia mandrillaris]
MSISVGTNEVSLLELPKELLQLILEHIPTVELFPNVFLACRALLAVLQEDFSWQRRCLLDFAQEELLEETWLETYKTRCVGGWDPENTTRPPGRLKPLSPSPAGFFTSCGASASVCLEGPRANVLFNKNSIRWVGSYSYVMSRSKRSWSKGLNCFDLVIRGHKGGHVYCVGVVDDTWDCANHCPRYSTTMPRSWVLWSQSQWYNLEGSAFTTAVPERTTSQDWKEGDVIGVMLDFRPKDETTKQQGRTIYFFKNGQLLERIPMPPDVEQLWAVVQLYNNGDEVELCPRQQFSLTMVGCTPGNPTRCFERTLLTSCLTSSASSTKRVSKRKRSASATLPSAAPTRGQTTSGGLERRPEQTVCMKAEFMWAFT